MKVSHPVIWSPDSPTTRRAEELFHSCDVLFLIGPAGTGKTHTALGLALPRSLNQGRKCFVTRPMVGASPEGIGYLPGDVNEKFSPYFAPFEDCLPKLTIARKEEYLSWFEVCPLDLMRGRNIEGVGILDEAQNATSAELKLFCTRLCGEGKLIICGDPAQTDIDYCDLIDVVKAQRGTKGVGVVIFNAERDNRRHKILPSLLKNWPRREK